MKKIVLNLVFALLGIGMMWAIPANNQYVAKRLADGSTVMVRLAGDEFFNYMVTEDGRIVKEVNGSLVETGIRESDMGARYIAGRRKMSKLMMKPNQRRVVAKTTSGAYSRNLVILVNFSDKCFSYPKSQFESILNQDGYSDYGATGSVKEYFTDNSGGQYSPQFDVYGPYTLDHNTAYYGGATSNDNDARPAQMVLDAMRKLAADQNANVNFADYDGNNDGYIDNVFIYYAGCGENYSGNSSDYVWPHRWVVGDWNTDAYDESDFIFGGKVLYNYGCTSELAGYCEDATLCGIGAFCHEFSHLLGLMDLYVTDYYSGHKTVGAWDIMCDGPYNNSEHTPAGYSTFERFALGWINPPVISTQNSYNIDYTLSSHEGYIITSTGKFNYDFDNPVPSEYFVLENRQQESWDEYIPGHGLLIEKIKWDADSWYSNVGNNDPNNMVVDIIEAGGSTDPYGSASDPFPGSYNVTSYSPYRDYPLTDIREIGKIICFDVKGGAPKGPFIVVFDDRGFGVADTTSLKEDTVYSGVVLPNVTANDGYEFVGWCASMTGNSTEISGAGTTFHPKRNTILFAVYKQNGVVVEDYYGECLSEHFSKLGNSNGIDITTDIDAYSDNRGWSGNMLESDFGMVKVGSETSKGFLISPEIALEGNIDIAFIITQDVRSYFGVVSEDGQSSDYPLALKGPGVVRVSLYDVAPNSKIKFVSDLNSYSIGEIYFCGDKVVTPVTEIEESSDEPTILREKVIGGRVRIEGLKEGMKVMVVDGIGRILMTRDADSDVMEFDAPETVYFIKIL